MQGSKNSNNHCIVRLRCKNYAHYNLYRSCLLIQEITIIVITKDSAVLAAAFLYIHVCLMSWKETRTFPLPSNPVLEYDYFTCKSPPHCSVIPLLISL